MENKSFTDAIHQRVRLFVEGVELPWSSISITSGMGGLPNANITVPAQAGILDIARFYSPKVAIFYSDRLQDYEDNDANQDKLLFSGVIAQTSYQKSKDNATVGVSFSCVHRYHLIGEMLIDYSGWLSGDPLDPNTSEGVKADVMNSQAAIFTALAGITRKHDPSGSVDQQEISLNNPDGKPTTLPGRYSEVFNSIQGMPSIMMNFWGQMKRASFNKALRQGDQYYSESFIRIYQPLVEDGLQFFDRLVGHYPIEALVDAELNRVDPCPQTPGQREKILIAPAYQMFLASSVQAQMSVSAISSFMQNSGEVTSIYGMFTQFYESIDYEILTLASPAMVASRKVTEFTAAEAAEFSAASGSSDNSVETHAVDTIVKPKMPFYYAPTCNVLFPGMYTNLQVMYDELNVPSRINVKNIEGPSDIGYRTNFRAPHSIREAIASKIAGVNGSKGYNPDMKYSLLSSTGPSVGAIGRFEQGRGIKMETMPMPRWLSHFSQSTLGATEPITDTSPDASKEANRVDALKQLSAGWAKRYPGDQTKTLNPYSVEDVDISAHHRILFTAADYYYTQVFARSKMGSVDCPFNPHIVPGYPMDILEANPQHPSFHAMCISVTHSFTASSANTSVSFTAAMTYSELNNYYIPFINPMLQIALGLATNPTLVGQTDASVARKTADEFYRYTLGVPAVAPDEIMDFSTMRVKPVAWNSTMTKWTTGSTASVTGSNGGEVNPMLSFEGNLSLVQRPIESREDIQKSFKTKFIEMSPGNYASTVIKYNNKALTDDAKFEIGQSQFLTYDTYFGNAIVKQNVTVTSSPDTSPDGSGITSSNTDASGQTQYTRDT